MSKNNSMAVGAWEWEWYQGGDNFGEAITPEQLLHFVLWYGLDTGGVIAMPWHVAEHVWHTVDLQPFWDIYWLIIDNNLRGSEVRIGELKDYDNTAEQN